jgi:hypothetical protein
VWFGREVAGPLQEEQQVSAHLSRGLAFKAEMQKARDSLMLISQKLARRLASASWSDSKICWP